MSDDIENEDVFTPGQILREMRIERGLDVDHVSNALHIMPGFITAIEENDFAKITTGLTFAKGYTRAYAKYLGADPDPLIEAFEKMHQPVKKRSVKHLPSQKTKSIVVGESRSSKIIKKSLWLAAILAVLLAAFILVKKQNWLGFNDPVAVNSSNAAPLKLSPEQPVPDLNINEKDIKNQGFNDDVSGDDLNVSEPLTANSEPLIVSDELIFELADDSWIEVRDASGNRLFADLARRGKSLEVKGDAPFAIILGDGRAVTLTLNGRNVSFSYGRNNYAEFTAQ